MSTTGCKYIPGYTFISRLLCYVYTVTVLHTLNTTTRGNCETAKLNSQTESWFPSVNIYNSVYTLTK